MDQRERINDFDEALRVAFDYFMANLWTAMPAIIQSYNAVKGTCVAQPAIKARVRNNATGTESWETMPLLVDVPVIFPQAGGFAITLPVKAGDECLIIFGCRCIDGWWQQGGIQTQAELRMLDLSDGFAIPGPRSQPKMQNLPNVSTTSVQIRTEDGTAYIELAPGGIVNIKAPGGVNITGALVATGEGTFNGGHTVSAHRHGGVTAGAANTNTPTG